MSICSVGRRGFLLHAAAFSAAALGGAARANTARPSNTVAILGYDVELKVISEGWDGIYCWFHPHAGAIPDNPPYILMTMQKFLAAHSDVFMPVETSLSRDFGKTWKHLPDNEAALGRRPQPAGIEEGICDFMPKWHAKSGRMLGTGHSVRYKDNKLVGVRPRCTVWSVYNPETGKWTPWQALKMPDDPKFGCAGAGYAQRVDLPDGDILLPIYSKAIPEKKYFATVARCRFDGTNLTYVTHGNEMTIDVSRGFVEPSLARYGSKYYLTLRNDAAAYVAASDDGMHFDTPVKWRFDDGAELGSYNTQAHWVTHDAGLLLCYTRRGAGNDHVIRHRAPLFIAQADPERRVVLRATERILVPNKGAQLGNFSVTEVNENESWVTTSEGMAPPGAEKYGANGRVYVARLLWKIPNAGYLFR